MINQFEIKIIEKLKNNLKFDFFIDGIQLGSMLGINRLDDLRFCDFDLDILTIDKLKFPNYDRKKIVNGKINELIGVDKPANQFQTNRIVLYRCHCGSDYCGVISFEIEFNDDYVLWKDIRFELDDETENTDVKIINILKFDKEKYIQEFNRFVSSYLA